MPIRRPSVFIIGSGRAATALAYCLRQAGVPVLGMWGRNAQKTKVAAKRARIRAFTSKFPVAVMEQADIVLLAVSDGAIAELSKRLAASGAFRKGQIIAHTSGFHGPEILFAPRGALKASFHPCQSLADLKIAAKNLPGSTAVIDGPPPARKKLKRLADSLGMRSLVVAAHQKIAYHAGAVIASNYLVTIAEAALRTLALAGIKKGAAKKILLPLMKGTLANLEARDPKQALTGPLSRGDTKTIEGHLQALCADPLLRLVYSCFGEATRELFKIK
jgi:predicted short-subunit dehydrogenase-like oxidoreductase (DUF2520 family)